MIFVKNFPRKIKRKRVSDRFCLSYRTKYQNGEIYPTIGRCGICFFARTAFFLRGVFSHARVRACGHMRARTHLCNACAFIMAREERNFSCRRFMIVLRSFSSGELPKSKIAEFSEGGQCRKLQNPVKNVNFGLKRLRNGFLRR